MVQNSSIQNLGTLADPLSAIEYAINSQKSNKINQYYPDKGPLRRELYPKHIAALSAGKEYRTRGIIAANRIGKTESIGVFETVLHLTGRYPAWWQGHRFKKPIKAWVAGDTSKTTKEILQDKMLGPIGNFGTGMLPKDTIVRTTPKAGIPDAIDTFYVKHVSGGVSVCSLKSFDQKRESFQGTEQDWIHLDEEPDESIFTECVLRTMATGSFVGGRILLTFTPINGWTDLVDQFLNEERREKANRYVMTLTWDDAPHLSKEEKDDLYSQIPEYQRKARAHGVPELGSGAIYPIDDAEIVVQPFPIPDHWSRGFGLDVGGRTAATWVAHDRDTDVMYLYDEYYREKAEPSVHAAAIKARGAWIPGWCDPAANQSSQIDGRKLLDMYKAQGLILSKADNAVESGILKVYDRMTTGRLKIFASCTVLLEEKRKYRRDMKGKIVKQNDHLCFTAGTLVRTPSGNVPIEHLVAGDIISTPLGKAHVMVTQSSEALTVPWNGTRVTPEHPVFCKEKGWIRVDALRNNDSICVWNQSFLTESLSGVRPLILMMFPRIARFVIKSLLVTNTLNRSPVVDPVDISTEKVYSLKTEHGCYFANDVLVSNCDSLRYLCAAPLNGYVTKVVQVRKTKQEPWGVYPGGRAQANGWMAS